VSVLRSFARIVDGHTAAVTIASLLATWICIRAGYAIELPDGLIAIAVVFPLGFAINHAFARRDKALESYASIKASAAALYFAHRDWISTGAHQSLGELRAVTIDVLQNIHKVLESQQAAPTHIERVYAGFSRISECNERLRANGVSSSEMARAHEYAHA